MVIPTFIGQALCGEAITVHGSGEQTRCFGYVKEAVECLVRIADASHVAGEVINIGNDQEITVNQLASMVKEITGSSSEIVHTSYDVAYSPGFEDMCRRVPCVEKVERLLGFRPRMPVEQIIRLVVDDVRPRIQPKWTLAEPVTRVCDTPLPARSL
jgi:UDP-glucose 4-epimerase